MAAESLTTVLQETLALFGGSGTPLTTNDVADQLPIGRRSTYERLDRLVESDRLKTKKVGANGRVWWRPSTESESESRLSDRRRTERDHEGGKQQQASTAARFEALFENCPDMIDVLNSNGRLISVNRRLCTNLGYTEPELIGKGIWEYDQSIDKHGVKTLLSELSVDEPQTFEAQYLRADGSTFPVEVNLIRLSMEEEDRYLAISRDITDRKQRERQLEQYETIVETVTDGIYAVDEDANFVMVNEGFCELTGYERDELIGSHARLVTSEEITPKAETLSVSAEINAGERETASIELDVRTSDGETVPCETRLAPFGEGEGRCGVTRDISEQLRREQSLRDRIRQQEVVTELGKNALEDGDLDELMAEAAELISETLDTDYCKVLDLDADTEELLLRQGIGWGEGIVGSATVSAVEAESQASHTLKTEQTVVVSDLTTERRFSGPALLTDHDVRSGISVIIGSLDSPWGILGTHDTEPREFSEHDANFVQAVANILATAINHHQHEQQLIAQREQVDALNNLNTVIREITTAVIEQSTREEIEATVCERLAATDSYCLAWIGEINTATQEVDLRTEAGVTGYTDGITVSLDQDDPLASGPTGRALHTGEIQIVNDILADSKHDPWRKQVKEYGFHSSAAIPIVHEGTVYGVLNVYADRRNAFEQQERAVIDQLGEVIGHAIAATERKRALMSTELVELEFRIQDLTSAFDVTFDIPGTTTLDHVIPIADSEFLVYGTVTADAIESLTGLVDVLPHWETVDFYTADDPIRFELRVSDPPILSEIASYGGYVDSAIIEDGDYQMTIHLSPTADVSRVADLVREAYPQVRLLRRQQITKPNESSGRIKRRLTETLTDRQSAVLETAYHAGYFEWPRDSSAQDLASTLGVAPATFHQHLRKAEKQVFDELLSNTSQQRLTATPS
jgi:PAS domain S-box-containing protein